MAIRMLFMKMKTQAAARTIGATMNRTRNSRNSPASP
jgi:hypothetical protein